MWRKYLRSLQETDNTDIETMEELPNVKDLTRRCSPNILKMVDFERSFGGQERDRKKVLNSKRGHNRNAGVANSDTCLGK